MTATARAYRYQLPRKAIKGDCPDCGPKHRKTLSRYVDSQTGEPLPHPYGRCDRESNCGYHFSPYHKTASGLSYADEVYQTWKDENHAAAPRQRNPVKLDAEHALETRFLHTSQPLLSLSSPSSAHEAVPTDVPVFCLPDEVFIKSLGHHAQNQFYRLLESRYGTTDADYLMERFQIGTSKYWYEAGACVFWFIDEQGRKRGAQIKLFDETFHTVKYVDRDGRRRSRTSWVHSVLLKQYERAGKVLPDWLSNYVEQADFCPCLFGLPQLLTEPADKPVAIVEAPKTAVICTRFFPEYVWLAVVGRSYLKAERLMPLKGRTIVLFPDLAVEGKDYQYWQKKAGELQADGFTVSVSDYLEQTANDEDRVKGMDLADYLLQLKLAVQPTTFRLPALIEHYWSLFDRPPLFWNSVAAHWKLQRCIESLQASSGLLDGIPTQLLYL